MILRPRRLNRRHLAQFGALRDIAPGNGVAVTHLKAHKVLNTFTLCSAVICASVFDAPPAALADTHIPSIDISPMSITSTSGNITTAPGVRPVNGNLLLTGSVHLPLSKKVIFSYDHITNGIIYASLPRVAIGGKYVYSTLDLRDYVENFRIDAPVTHNVYAQLGTGFRHRECCPASGDPRNPAPAFYHDNYLTLVYNTPAIAALHNTELFYSLTGHASPHNSDTPAAVAAANALGYPDQKRTEYGVTQAATVVVPISPRHGLSFAGTLTWGAFNYYANEPIPIYYDVTILTLNEVVDKYLSFGASVDNFAQRPQGYPFPPGSGAVGASLNLVATLHVGP